MTEKYIQLSNRTVRVESQQTIESELLQLMETANKCVLELQKLSADKEYVEKQKRESAIKENLKRISSDLEILSHAR